MFKGGKTPTRGQEVLSYFQLLLERENTKTDGNQCFQQKKNKVEKTNDEAINAQLPKNAYEEMPIVKLKPIPPKEMGREASS